MKSINFIEHGSNPLAMKKLQVLKKKISTQKANKNFKKKIRITISTTPRINVRFKIKIKSSLYISVDT